MTRGPMTPETFLDLSAGLAYRLSGQFHQTLPKSLVNLILGEAEYRSDRRILEQAIRVIRVGYGDNRRKMGPLAVIHPLRVAAVLTRVTGTPTQADLLNALLHDVLEDLTEESIGADRFEQMQRELRILAGLLTESERDGLDPRMQALTHTGEHSYNEYLANIMALAAEKPDLIRAKLADRLDNTLDVGVDLHGVKGQGAFGSIFDLLFLGDQYPGIKADESYVPLTNSETRQILANLFKNTEFVNVLRTEGCNLDSGATTLRDEVITASLRIARFLVQDALIHLPVGEQREAVKYALDYCRSGGLNAVYTEQHHPMDGLLLGNKKDRKEKISRIATDPQTAARVGIIFLGLFSIFRSNPSFKVVGIDRHGISPSTRS